MEIKKTMANALKEMVVPELNKIKEDVNSVKGVLELTNKRLDDINLHLADHSRRIDETNKRIDETNDRLNRLDEVIVRRDEHTTLDQKVMALEKDVQELTRISHKKSTAMPNLPMPAALHSLRLLDVHTVRLRRLRSCALHPQASLTSRYDFL